MWATKRTKPFGVACEGRDFTSQRRLSREVTSHKWSLMEAGGVEKDYTDTLWLLAAIKSITWGKKQVQIHISVHWERQKQLFPREHVTENYSFSCKILTTKSVFWRDAFLGHMQTCLQKKLYLVRNNYKLSARVKTLPMWIWNFRTSVVNERNLIHISLPLLVILYSRSYTDIEDWGFTWNLSRVN